MYAKLRLVLFVVLLTVLSVVPSMAESPPANQTDYTWFDATPYITNVYNYRDHSQTFTVQQLFYGISINNGTAYESSLVIELDNYAIEAAFPSAIGYISAQSEAYLSDHTMDDDEQAYAKMRIYNSGVGVNRDTAHNLVGNYQAVYTDILNDVNQAPTGVKIADSTWSGREAVLHVRGLWLGVPTALIPTPTPVPTVGTCPTLATPAGGNWSTNLPLFSHDTLPLQALNTVTAITSGDSGASTSLMFCASTVGGFSTQQDTANGHLQAPNTSECWVASQSTQSCGNPPDTDGDGFCLGGGFLVYASGYGEPADVCAIQAYMQDAPASCPTIAPEAGYAPVSSINVSGAVITLSEGQANASRPITLRIASEEGAVTDLGNVPAGGMLEVSTNTDSAGVAVIGITSGSVCNAVGWYTDVSNIDATATAQVNATATAQVNATATAAQATATAQGTPPAPTPVSGTPTPPSGASGDMFTPEQLPKVLTLFAYAISFLRYMGLYDWVIAAIIIGIIFTVIGSLLGSRGGGK